MFQKLHETYTKNYLLFRLGCSSVIQHVLSMHENLSSIPSTKNLFKIKYLLFIWNSHLYWIPALLFSEPGSGRINFTEIHITTNICRDIFKETKLIVHAPRTHRHTHTRTQNVSNNSFFNVIHVTSTTFRSNSDSL